MNVTNLKSFKIGDFIIILALSIATIVSLFASRTDKAGTVIFISSNGQNVTIPLSKDTLLNLSGPIGNSKLKIENHIVYITNAPCSQRICQHQGRISKIGQSLICVPNKIVVQIMGKRKSNLDIDSTTM